MMLRAHVHALRDGRTHMAARPCRSSLPLVLACDAGDANCPEHYPVELWVHIDGATLPFSRHSRQLWKVDESVSEPQPAAQATTSRRNIRFYANLYRAPFIPHDRTQTISPIGEHTPKSETDVLRAQRANEHPPKARRTLTHRLKTARV
eukprot:6089555-Prymnesium_polylepis.1